MRRLIEAAAVIIIILSFFLWKDIAVGQEMKTLEQESSPEIIRPVVVKEQLQKEVCEEAKYRYSYVGGDVISLGDYVSPNLVLQNLEDRGGIYRINFSYIDESRFPYDTFGGSNLQKMLRSGNISLNDSEFRSDNYALSLAPEDSIYINQTTRKPRPGTYWAIASIEEPTYTKCSKVTEYVNVTKNITFTEVKDHIRQAATTITLAGSIGLIFPVWALCVLIFYLAAKILSKNRKKRP